MSEMEMELNEEERQVKTDFEAACRKLNMDQDSMDAAWTSYDKIKDNFTLEGEHLEWLGCALYVAGQNLSLQSVEGEMLHGNSISLTQILRTTKLNLIEFFKKMKKWIEMASLPLSFQNKIEALERKFEVASIINDKYKKVFQDLFQIPDQKQQTPNSRRARKASKNRPCSGLEVFRFGWTLYIHVKSQYPQINDDLVNSHHLLLCCIDMLYCIALVNRRRDLLNLDCPFLPEDWATADYDPNDLPSILPQLCSKYNGIEKECRVIRDFHWKDPITKMFRNKVLVGGASSSKSHRGAEEPMPPYMNILAPANFFQNDKSLNREYEMNVLAEGDFDERVFLHPSASEEIGTPVALPVHTSHQGAAVGGGGGGALLSQHTPPRHVQFGTPLLGRELLASKDHHRLTPASEATHSVTHLHLLLENCQAEPSEFVRKLCNSCMSDPLPQIEQSVCRLSERFLLKSPLEGESQPSSFAQRHLHLAVTLYYKLLDAIMRDEERKNPDFGSLQTILEYELFQKSLFALCVEIVLYSYNSQSRAFPWVLEAFEISAYHFYKLIEPAIKHERDFPRSIVKHLNQIEEQVLGQLAWKSESPLFDAIDAAGSIPPYRDVALPTPIGGIKTSGASPLIHPRLKSLGTPRGLESPLSSLHERLTSPGSSSARRQLFSPGGTAVSARRTPIPIAPKPSSTSTGAAARGGGGGGTGAGGVSGVPVVPKPTGGGVTITPINPSLLQQMKGAHSPAKASTTTGLPQMKGTSPSASSGISIKQEGGVLSPTKTASASKASTGTQTSPHRPPSSTQQQSPSSLSSPSSSSSPAKLNITLTSASGVVSTNLLGACNQSSSSSTNTSSITMLSPSKITIGSLLSPRGGGGGGGVGRGGMATAALIPTSPPIPSVTVTPSASPIRTPQRTTPATYGSSTRQTLGGSSTGGMLSMTPGTPGSGGSGLAAAAAAARPKRTGSLALFYRKMYQLAYIRIRDLCERLELDTDFVQKVWTSFEYCMLKSPDLMRDRHIDQIIMCCTYILAKCLRMDMVTFQEIMRQYRHQPQAKSHVYRSVLLNSGPRHRPCPDTSTTPEGLAPPTTSSASGNASSSSSGTVAVAAASEESSATVASKDTPVDQLLYRPELEVGSRGDIIQFYNKLFIGFIKDFVLKFSPNEPEAKSPALSPVPVIRKAAPSPRKVSRNHNIFVSPCKGGPGGVSASLSPLAKTYVIQKSPPSKLQEINEAMRIGTKRPLDVAASAGLSPAAKRALLTHIHVPSKSNKFMQALNSVASDRAKSASQQ